MPDIGIVEVLLVATAWIIPIALIVAIGRLIVGALRRPDPAVQTLQTRLASGEIDEAEYLRLRSVLQRG
jgi:uncharacterized membrane protein